jgi:hypothetical protein
MTAFLYTTFALFAIGFLGNLKDLFKGQFPLKKETSLQSYVCSMFIMLCLLFWIIFLIFTKN